MEQIPLRWPAPFWGGPGGTGSCSPPSLRDTPLASSQPCCFGGPGIAFPRGSIVFWEVDVCCGAGREGTLPAVWLLVAGSGGTRLVHWDHLDPGGDGALGALVCAFGEQGTVPEPAGWHLCPQAPQSCSTRVGDSPHDVGLLVLCSCFMTS